ncbi:hypothetical protein LCGC14_0901700 [marine sediment metagenome]|uniref:VOC domain-containing protein n=1 Tax=marine sediment metagenome TaxID=412755 RepID=A0A0F9P151_9ZZZZ|nr:MAG: hypothetical protein Lokiarch_51890 [Candidatus Lokiarchaeum sp. GC14_75]
MTVKLSPLVNIGVVVPNAEGAYQLLHNLFGARKVQEELTNFLNGDLATVIHVGLGDVVLQFIEPIAEEGVFYNHLLNKGPGVHNLTFIVEDIKDVIKEMEKQDGIDVLFTFDLEWEKFIASDYTNPNGKTIYMMDTMEKIGFHLGLSEKPGRSELILPQTQYVTGFDNLIGDASTMLHIELVTPNTEKTFEFLQKVFGSEKVEIEFAGILDSDFMRIIHVNLSNVVLQYCQPIGKTGTWYDLLQKNGAYVHNLNFLVDDIKETIRKFKKEEIPRIFKNRLAPNSPPYYMMNTIDKVGFHLENGQMPTGEEFDFFSKWVFTHLKKD